LKTTKIKKYSDEKQYSVLFILLYYCPLSVANSDEAFLLNESIKKAYLVNPDAGINIEIHMEIFMNYMGRR
jgi:hypothetical protein